MPVSSPARASSSTASPAYVDRFFDLRMALESLDNACEGLAAAHGLDDFGLDLEEVGAKRAATRLLSASIDGSDPDSDATGIERRVELVEAQTELIERMTNRLEDILRHRGTAEVALVGANAEQRTKLRRLNETFAKIGRRTLEAEDPSTLRAIKGSIASALVRLDELIDEIEAETGSSLEALTEQAGDLRKMVLADLPEAPPPRVEIGWDVVGEAAEGATAQRDDRVAFAISISSREPLPASAIEIDFGDGTRMKRGLPEGPEEVTVSVAHRYRVGGEFELSVGWPGGEELGRTSLSVGQRSRATERGARLSNGDRIVQAAAVTLAVGSGMTALYLCDPSWGEPGDYLEAVLWGGVVAEATVLAAAIADRAFWRA